MDKLAALSEAVHRACCPTKKPPSTAPLQFWGPANLRSFLVHPVVAELQEVGAVSSRQQLSSPEKDSFDQLGNELNGIVGADAHRWCMVVPDLGYPRKYELPTSLDTSSPLQNHLSPAFNLSECGPRDEGDKDMMNHDGADTSPLQNHLSPAFNLSEHGPRDEGDKDMMNHDATRSALANEIAFLTPAMPRGALENAVAVPLEWQAILFTPIPTPSNVLPDEGQVEIVPEDEPVRSMLEDAPPRPALQDDSDNDDDLILISDDPCSDDNGGPQPSGPQPSGPQPSGPQPSGPQPSGPQPALEDEDIDYEDMYLVSDELC